MNSYSKYKFSNNNIYSERALNPDLNVLKKPNSFNNINYQPNIQPTNLNLKNDIYSITEPDDEKEFSKTMNQNLKILENTLNKANSNLNNNKDYNYYNEYDDYYELTEPIDNTDTILVYREDKIDYTFIWDEGGNSVNIIGSFCNWKEQYEMEKDEQNNIFKFSLPLKNEKYQYKFIVDGVWKYSEKQDKIDDGKGNINNFIDLTNTKPIETTILKSPKKTKEKSPKKKEVKKEEIKENSNSNSNLNKSKKKGKKKREYGNIYPNYISLNEPKQGQDIAKAFNFNESKQNKIGNKIYNKYFVNQSYSSNKSYMILSNFRHTILSHILLQKKLKINEKNKLGISFRFREKETTLIYYN